MCNCYTIEYGYESYRLVKCSQCLCKENARTESQWVKSWKERRAKILEEKINQLSFIEKICYYCGLKTITI